MSSNPCTQYHFHKGTPLGSVSDFAGVKTYITTSNVPELANANDVKAVVILVADVFGIGLNNTRVLADKFAKEIGAKVYVPDFFDGNDLTVVAPTEEDRKKFDFATWLGKYDPRTVALPVLERVVAQVKNAHPSAKIGAVGYCYGAKPVLHVTSSEVKKEFQIDAAAFAHGSKLAKEDFDLIQKNLLVITPEKDHAFTPELMEAAMAKGRELAPKGIFTKFVYYPGVTHGFAARGDEENEFTARAMANAAADVISFFRLELL